jgi:hypothetical protein
MRALLIFLVISFSTPAQTLIRYDYMETWDWEGAWWTPILTAGWYTNASVSPTQSAMIYGLGTGTSGFEQDWYSMPNVVGLDASRQYQFRFRLASYTFSNSTSSARGVDAGDYVSVQVSTNGGVTYVTELRITGNTNATWPYNSTGTISHTANGSFTNSAAPAGDVYQSLPGVSTTGPSVISLNLPTGLTQVAVDIFCRVNAAGEEWWIDNVELWDITPIALPVELVEFTGVNTEDGNLLQWKTASENNNDYFTLHWSESGIDWEEIAKVKGAGNSTEPLVYSFIDSTHLRNGVIYYRLSQTDFDGSTEVFNIVAIESKKKMNRIVKIVNLRGQEVEESDFTEKGIYFEVYEDGTVRKIWR